MDTVVTRRVFVDMPADVWLSYEQNSIKWGVVRIISKLGYVPEVFDAPADKRDIKSLTLSTSWSPEQLQRVLRRCVGAVLIGFPRWLGFAPRGGSWRDIEFSDWEWVGERLTTEYIQYESALLHQLQLPTLYLAESHISRRVGIDRSAAKFITEIPKDANAEWLTSKGFEISFKSWIQDIQKRYDIFLAYSAKSKNKAEVVRKFLEDRHVRVMDWMEHFTVGDSILGQVSRASRECTTGIFLFTGDDPLEGTPSVAAPRDNVVFEAGYFASVKGDDRILIIKEPLAKMPADLGGKIWVAMNDGQLSKDSQEKVLNFLQTAA